MKRRTFIKNGILGALGAGIMPDTILSGRNCTVTHSDILGPYWSPNHPQRNILANSDEPGTRIFISGIVTADDCDDRDENFQYAETNHVRNEVTLRETESRNANGRRAVDETREDMLLLLQPQRKTETEGGEQHLVPEVAALHQALPLHLPCVLFLPVVLLHKCHGCPNKQRRSATCCAFILEGTQPAFCYPWLLGSGLLPCSYCRV